MVDGRIYAGFRAFQALTLYSPITYFVLAALLLAARAVLPAAQKVDIEKLKEVTGAGQVLLASEKDFEDAFPGCELGAMPPFGNLYHMDVYMEESLARDEEIAFNAGSHTELVKLAYETKTPFTTVLKVMCEVAIKNNGKRTAISHGVMFYLGPVFRLTGGVGLLLFVPTIYGSEMFSNLSFAGDLILALYFVFFGTLGMALGAAESGHPYSAIGITRGLSQVTAAELPFALAVFAVAVLGVLAGVSWWLSRDAGMQQGAQEEVIAAARRLTGEGSQTGRQITGDAWNAMSRVTGTEGASSQARNPSERGAPRGAGANAVRFREEVEPAQVPPSRITGSAGNAGGGALVTLSGGARG